MSRLDPTRRAFLGAALAGGCASIVGRPSPAAEPKAAIPRAADQPAADERRKLAESDKALIAITLDLEMSRNFPTWETTHWDFEKGNLNEPTKRYTAEACRRVRAAGGVLHTFVVGRVFEQENVDWLRQIANAGHPIGNHTYDHVNVLATRRQDIQARFARSPWLIEGTSVPDVIRENIQLANLAMRTRLGIEPAGFRTPGGFQHGLTGRSDVQRMLQGLGFTWVSSQSPRYQMNPAAAPPDAAVFDSIVAAQREAQPFVYPSGLVEVPISPISDIGAFRTGRWPLESFMRAIQLGVEWAIEHRAVFDFLAHPSCMYVTDPQFETIALILDLVRKAGPRVAIVDLDTIARRAAARSTAPGK